MGLSHGLRYASHATRDENGRRVPLSEFAAGMKSRHGTQASSKLQHPPPVQRHHPSREVFEDDIFEACAAHARR